MRDFHFPGRSVSIGTRYAAATSHQQATLVAIDVLRGGGNAVDAAVAASALLGVVEPHSVGIGGDTFVLYWSARDRKLHGLNGSGYAPEGLSLDWLKRQGLGSIGGDSVHSVTIPGAVRSWEALLNAFGSRKLGELLQPAIAAARDGWPVAERIASDWPAHVARLAASGASRDQFLINGNAPKTGEVLRTPLLAKTLEAIAEGGADAFYTGPLAAGMVKSLNEAGGRHTLADFAEWYPQMVEPVRINYRGHDVYQIPPNGQGLVTAMMLNILAGFDHRSLDPRGADRFHLQIEAYRLASAARDAYIADPNHARVPTEEMISERYADRMRDRIDLRRSMNDAVIEPIGPNDTIYLTTADAEGNFCSFISSISGAFGSAITCSRTGVLFQNRGSGFSTRAGHPNTVGPRKRSLHTIIPGFVTKDGTPFLSYGVMQGFYQPVGQVQVLQNIVEFGMDVQAAIDAPRGLRTGNAFEAERSIPVATLEELARRGHPIATAGLSYGGAQAIMPVNGVLFAGSDARKDGLALAV
ncbi:gamma-glutamyltransferase family protein [Rhizobium sp. BK251]|uniref:gamma-glutamyltransferase family protein n=1 Tax=Rhizobium sp. BK251 TaxID=2512125 RepID=UPI001043B23A|nr:gamma-glutamyltransferase family protein [Rhizobium sp. BK251]TCL64068.1 gamma-glutamyltransferase 2 [Rhizobium sp. BK251]